MAGIRGGSDKDSRSKNRLQTAGVDPILSSLGAYFCNATTRSPVSPRTGIIALPPKTLYEEGNEATRFHRACWQRNSMVPVRDRAAIQQQFDGRGSDWWT